MCCVTQWLRWTVTKVVPLSTHADLLRHQFYISKMCFTPNRMSTENFTLYKKGGHLFLLKADWRASSSVLKQHSHIANTLHRTHPKSLSFTTAMTLQRGSKHMCKETSNMYALPPSLPSTWFLSACNTLKQYSPSCIYLREGNVPAPRVP